MLFSVFHLFRLTFPLDVEKSLIMSIKTRSKCIWWENDKGRSDNLLSHSVYHNHLVPRIYFVAVSCTFFILLRSTLLAFHRLAPYDFIGTM